MSKLLAPAERAAVIERFLGYVQNRQLERVCRDAPTLAEAEAQLRQHFHGGEWSGTAHISCSSGWIEVKEWHGKQAHDRISYREAARYARRAATQLALELA